MCTNSITAYVIIRKGNAPWRSFELSRQRTNIGRSPDNDIVFDDVAVSARHASIYRDSQGQFILHNEQSTAGTTVNGQRIDECRLADGDMIEMGQTVLTFISISQLPRMPGAKILTADLIGPAIPFHLQNLRPLSQQPSGLKAPQQVSNDLQFSWRTNDPEADLVATPPYQISVSDLIDPAIWSRLQNRVPSPITPQTSPPSLPLPAWLAQILQPDSKSPPARPIWDTPTPAPTQNNQ
jgi:predicted component of type VI protein secretion system